MGLTDRNLISQRVLLRWDGMLSRSELLTSFAKFEHVAGLVHHLSRVLVLAATEHSPACQLLVCLLHQGSAFANVVPHTD